MSNILDIREHTVQVTLEKIDQHDFDSLTFGLISKMANVNKHELNEIFGHVLKVKEACLDHSLSSLSEHLHFQRKLTPSNICDPILIWFHFLQFGRKNSKEVKLLTYYLQNPHTLPDYKLKDVMMIRFPFIFNILYHQLSLCHNKGFLLICFMLQRMATLTSKYANETYKENVFSEKSYFETQILPQVQRLRSLPFS